uniref:Uncharacterized protein n=1 Tax=Daphnia galeata TaxID=27404 RepID=A0A8J2RJ18_9CRUS|nr:unnamed protein product [Daphnia galeata]
MTVLTFGVASTIAVTGNVAPFAAPALAGTLTGIVTISAAPGTGGISATVAGSAGAGAVVGAISAAAENGSAVIGALLGSASSAAVTCGSAGLAGIVNTGLALDPLGWLVLGAEQDVATHHIGATFDCWKPVLRDESTEPSSGKLLKDILEDQRVKRIVVHESRNNWNLPQLRLINIWDEQFDIDYLVLLPSNRLVAHAVRVI